MLTLLRTRAAFWAGAGILAMAGAATSLAAVGLSQAEDETPAVTPPAPAEAKLPATVVEPLAGALEAEATAGDDEKPVADAPAIRGVPEDSPACDNVGCGEVTNPGGVTLHLPQPAVDGMNRAADNRAAAHDKENGGGNGNAKGNGKGKP